MAMTGARYGRPGPCRLPATTTPMLCPYHIHARAEAAIRTSPFTDVVSYVRLFAVGLAGVAIANTTNAMAAGLGSGAAGISAGILIRFVGHGLNLVLGPIAILVHGVRLNVLEFGLNHTGLTWSGVAYKPLIEQAA